MKLSIFGATGGIGRQLVALSLAEGHEVTAVARRADGLPSNVHAVTADLAAADRQTLQSAIAGAEAVLSGIGPRSTQDIGIVAPGTQAIVDAMTAKGVRRLVAVSAAPIGTVPSPGRPNPPKHDPGDGFFMRNLLSPLVKAILRRHYADLAMMEDILRASDLDWTIIRPPRLTNGPLTRIYRTAFNQNVHRGLTISRANVAHLMLGILNEKKTIRQVIGIAN